MSKHDAMLLCIQRAYPCSSVRLKTKAIFLRLQIVTCPAEVQVAKMYATLGFHARLEISALGPCCSPCCRTTQSVLEGPHAGVRTRHVLILRHTACDAWMRFDGASCCGAVPKTNCCRCTAISYCMQARKASTDGIVILQ